MKKLFFFAGFLFFVFPAAAQITDTGNNVGIGTSSPTYKLHVQSTGEGGILVKSQSNGTHGASNVIVDAATNFPARFIFRENGVNKGWIDYSSNKIGIRDGANQPLLTLKTDNGNVGLGTSNPAARLHVYDANILGSNSGDFHLLSRLQGRSSNHFMENTWLLRDTNGADWLQTRLHNGISIDVSYLTPTVDTRTWWERDPWDNIQSWGNGPQVYMSLVKGKLGIGTDNPLEKFQVNGAIYLNSGSDYDNIFWAHHNLNMGTRPGSYNHNVLNLRPGGASQGFLYSKLNMFIANSASSHEQKVQIHTDGNSFFNGGNVGIGTTNPDSKLTVAGNIHSREVKVTVNAGADFVFEDNYNLPSLEKVQQFIQENGHLPEIASAKDMEENGIHLAEMNIKLLQKIEELTLYAIEQEEKIKTLENKLEKVDELEKRLTELINKK